ncbi:MAG: DUF1772 domain-containing protein [Chloroflexota bacterium]
MLSSTFQPILIIATLFVALTAGLLFAFAIVVMPGTKNLNDAKFIRAFQAMDGVIQNNQPIFMLVWLGSVVALILAAAAGFGQVDSVQRLLLIASVALYIFGVQAPTIAINIPLNNEIQAVHVETMDSTEQREARAKFEERWNRANHFRTIVAVVVTLLLLSLLLLL